MAAPEIAHGVPVLAVPFSPHGREAPELVAVGLADVPGLSDQLGLGDHRVLGDDVEEGGHLVETAFLAGQAGGQVEAEAVDAHFGQPVPQRVHDQP